MQRAPPRICVCIPASSDFPSTTRIGSACVCQVKSSQVASPRRRHSLKKNLTQQGQDSADLRRSSAPVASGDLRAHPLVSRASTSAPTLSVTAYQRRWCTTAGRRSRGGSKVRNSRARSARGHPAAARMRHHANAALFARGAGTSALSPMQDRSRTHTQSAAETHAYARTAHRSGHVT